MTLALVMPRDKRVFASVLEARLALSSDKLGTVYRKAGSVFVVTALGSGTFKSDDWDAPALLRPLR